MSNDLTIPKSYDLRTQRLVDEFSGTIAQWDRLNWFQLFRQEIETLGNHDLSKLELGEGRIIQWDDELQSWSLITGDNRRPINNTEATELIADFLTVTLKPPSKYSRDFAAGLVFSKHCTPANKLETKNRIKRIITQEASVGGVELDEIFVDGLAGELSNCLAALV